GHHLSGGIRASADRHFALGWADGPDQCRLWHPLDVRLLAGTHGLSLHREPEQLHRRLPHRIRDHPSLSHLQACWICLGSGWACIKITSLSRWRNFAPAYCLGSLAMRPAVLGCLAALCAASAARAAVVADCNQVRDAQLRLRACSATAL